MKTKAKAANPRASWEAGRTSRTVKAAARKGKTGRFAESPDRKGIYLGTIDSISKGPNSEVRHLAMVRLADGHEIKAHFPTSGKILREHSTVFLRSGRVSGFPQVRYRIVKTPRKLRGYAPGSVNVRTAKVQNRIVRYPAAKAKLNLAPRRTQPRAFLKSVGAGALVLPRFRQAETQKPERFEESLSRKLVQELAKSSPDVNVLCEAYRMKREELGRLTGFSLRALAGWSAGQLPSQPAMRRLHEVRRLLDALAEIVKEESIPRWLHQPNPAFDRLTPLQVIELGEIDRIWAMVHDLGSGQPE